MNEEERFAERIRKRVETIGYGLYDATLSKKDFLDIIDDETIVMQAVRKAEDFAVSNRGVRFSRIWAMPNKDTFKIPAIATLLKTYVKDGKGWIDPFAGDNSPAEFTNDINPQKKASAHLHASDWLYRIGKFGQKQPAEYSGIIYDPPYSLRQVKECYDSLGLKMSFDDSTRFPENIKDYASILIKPNGLAICCGWNSIGFGKKRGFELIELMLVCHGGRHNDTIVTVESKQQEPLPA